MTLKVAGEKPPLSFFSEGAVRIASFTESVEKSCLV